MYGNRFFALLIVAIVPSASAHAVSYTATLLHPAGYFESYALGISGSVQVGSVTPTSGFDHAALWTSSSASVVSLDQGAFVTSRAIGASGATQVGVGYISDLGDRAILWNGSSQNPINLHPVGYNYSIVHNMSGTHQVGGATKTSALGRYHAMLWNGSAASAVDLHPTGFDISIGFGIFGNEQVGFAKTAANVEHAMKWNGTAASAVDLAPLGFTNSRAFDTSGASQVGYASGFTFVVGSQTLIDNNLHAMKWSGTAASAVDLHPSAFKSSQALGIFGDTQIGFAVTSDGIRHAMLWQGSAASVIDLNSLFTAMSPAFVGSDARGIGAGGLIVGNAYDANGTTYAVLLTPVPEPCTVVLLAAGLTWLALLRR